MDPISLGVGAVILGVGFLAGRFRRPHRKTTSLQYVCSCGHPWSQHDPETKKCHEKIGWDRNDCECRQYVGNLPLDLPSFENYQLPDVTDKP